MFLFCSWSPAPSTVHAGKNRIHDEQPTRSDLPSIAWLNHPHSGANCRLTTTGKPPHTACVPGYGSYLSAGSSPLLSLQRLHTVFLAGPTGYVRPVVVICPQPV